MQDSKILVNGWEVIHSSTLLLANGHEVRFQLIPEDPLNITVRFETTPPIEGEAIKKQIKFSGEENESAISLVNWNDALATSMVEPSVIAEDDSGHEFACMISAKRIGKVQQLFLQVMKRKKP